MASELRIEGLAELDKMLKTLPATIEGNVMRGGLRAGTKIFADLAKAAVPVDDGDLKKSVRVRTRNRRGQLSASVVAGNKKAWYAHLIEFGTASFYEGRGKTVGKPYEIKPSKKSKSKALKFGDNFAASVTHPGIKPQPFMRPALDDGSADAVEAMAEYIRRRLPQELAKVVK
jgi:HK97 gp10 family phage protein